MNKFAALSKIPGMTNESLIKASYEIMFKRIQQVTGQATFNLETFYTALQAVSKSLYGDGDPENIEKLLNNLSVNIWCDH